ncbi:MAG: hypothetical protein ACYCRH_11915 [Acidiferrobacteraceae bacterium]
MNAERSASSIYCDDVRQETGNKLSFMGVYRGTLLVPDFPFSFAKLCVVLTAVTPRNALFEKLTFRILKDKELIAETGLDPSGFVAEGFGKATVDDENIIMSATTIVTLVSFIVTEPVILRARVITESEELKASGLRIQRLADLKE